MKFYKDEGAAILDGARVVWHLQAREGGKAKEFFFTTKRDLTSFIGIRFASLHRMRVGMKRITHTKDLGVRVFSDMAHCLSFYRVKMGRGMVEYMEFCRNAAKAADEGLPPTSLQKHHICPRFMGGRDCRDNLVILTPADHVLAHILLGKALDEMVAKMKAGAKRDLLSDFKGRNPPYNLRHYFAKRETGHRRLMLLTYDENAL